MNIKSLLLGSAAALAAVSGAQAADAIVAAEPEPMEYVRVCDAFGTGYFYIPGTETCLKISGFVRFQTTFGEDQSGTSDWDAFARGFLAFDAKSDTEFGTLTGFFAIEADQDNQNSNNFKVDEAYIQLGGFKVGSFWSWWDKGLNGETDINGNDTTKFNSIAYIYDGGTFQAGVAVEELEGVTSKPNGVGVSAIVSATLGGVSFDLLGSYDSEVEEGAIRGLVSADLGPGVLQALAIWSSDPNAYWAVSEWSVAASYRFNATDKFAITPGAQYFGDIRNGVEFNDAYAGGGGSFGNGDAWKVGITADYQITEGLAARATVNYTEVDYDTPIVGAQDDFVSGFIRLQRDF
ncbi:porin [Ensifer aridi]|uniref:porin n=1 Tax=Ensifer aridi TaxID=1708715 RepID=UPI000A108DC7|nr:porin [Ensifer aridi]